MDNDKPEDIGPLPLSMVSLKRTGGKGTENTTYTAGYALHFTCKMKRCIAVMLNLCSPCTSKKDLSRHPVYSYNMLYKMLYITCYIGHDPVRNYICYITNYVTFFWLCNILYRKNVLYMI